MRRDATLTRYDGPDSGMEVAMGWDDVSGNTFRPRDCSLSDAMLRRYRRVGR